MSGKLLPLLVGTGLTAGVMLADDATVAGPTLGFTVDRAQSAVRPILGLPGAALLGPAATLPFTASRLFIAPGGRLLLAQEKESGRWQLIPDSNRPTESQVIDNLQSDGDRVVFSGDGAVAALYSASRQQVQVVRGLPGAPALGRTIDLSATPGLISALAISPDGDGVLMGVTTDGGGVLLYANGDGPPRQVAAAGQIAALAFVPGGSDALWADSARNQIALLKDVAGAAEVRVLASDADGVADPIAVAADADRYLAVTSAGKLLALSRTGGESQQLDCSCTASGLTALSRNSLWRLNDGSDGPLWVLDLAAPRLFFVPAGGQE